MKLFEFLAILARRLVPAYHDRVQLAVTASFMFIPRQPSLAKPSWRDWFRQEWHYFDLSRLGEGTDLIHLSHAYDLAGLPAALRSQRVRTMCIDLAGDRESLWRNLKKGCRYDIKRAETDGVVCDVTGAPSQADLGGFVADAEDLFKRKGMRVLPLNFYMRSAARGELLFSRAHHEGRTLTAHIHLIRGDRALLVSSISLLHERSPADRQRAGRANRLNHWSDMLALQHMGCASLDLGTYSETGAEDRPESQSLKAFKLEFGAREREAWYLTLALTRKGRLLHEMQRLRGLRSR